MNRSLWFLALLLFLTLARAGYAQDLARQPTAFTAWLDFQGKTTNLPIWVERVEKQHIKNDADKTDLTVYRVRFRHFAGLVDDLLLRVYFDDVPDAQPVLSGWNEIGRRVIDSQKLGQGLGMPSSETVSLPLAGVDYVDIETPGDGSTVRGMLAMAIRKSETQAGIDFAGAAPLTDPFGNGAPATTGSDDTLLFGRVKATLEPGVIALGTPSNSNQAAGFEVPLEKPPLIALLTFEVLNADIANPPHLTVNGKDLGDVNLTVTDLADPAMTGAVEAARPDVVYRYAGWLKCQKVVPGSLLMAGTNEILIGTPSNSEPVALRSVEVQLKYTPDATAP